MRVLTPAIAAVLLLAPAGAAHAATAVSKSGSLLSVRAASGHSNHITVAQSGATYLISESGGDTIAAGDRCTRVASDTVSCPVAGTAAVAIFAGDRDDKVTKTTALPGHIEGGSGDDVLSPGPAWSQRANELFGDGGADVLEGGPDADVLDGGPGPDVLAGGGGRDRADYVRRLAGVTVTIDGLADDGEPREGDDVRPDVEEVRGGEGADSLSGSAGPDQLSGGPGADHLAGRGGGDTLTGGTGDDRLDGGDGDDTLVATHADGADRFAGGPGRLDHVTYAGRWARVVIDLDGVADDGAHGEGDDVAADVEQVTGGTGADTITGSAADDVLAGGPGADTLRGAAGADLLRAQAGGGLLDGGTGDDTLEGGSGQDTFTGGAGTDRVDYWTHPAGVTVTIDGAPNDGYPGEYDDVEVDVEQVLGGAGADTIKGSPAANLLDGRGGRDVLDAVDGIAGNDWVAGDPSDACSSDKGDNQTGC